MNPKIKSRNPKIKSKKRRSSKIKSRNPKIKSRNPNIKSRNPKIKRRSSNKKIRKLGGERSLPKNYAEKQPSRERETDEERDERRLQYKEYFLSNKIIEWVKTFLKPDGTPRDVFISVVEFFETIIKLSVQGFLEPYPNKTKQLLSLNYADKVTKIVYNTEDGREKVELFNPQNQYPNFSFEKLFGIVDAESWNSYEDLEGRFKNVAYVVFTLKRLTKSKNETERKNFIWDLELYAIRLLPFFPFDLSSL